MSVRIDQPGRYRPAPCVQALHRTRWDAHRVQLRLHLGEASDCDDPALVRCQGGPWAIVGGYQGKFCLRIATLVRESSGGLPRVQALGLFLEDLGCAQVSMNLLDHTVTPIWRVWEQVVEHARVEGVEVRESELIGLCPLSALTNVADHVGVDPGLPDEHRITAAAAWLRVRDFEPTMALELRLAAVEAAQAG